MIPRNNRQEIVRLYKSGLSAFKIADKTAFSTDQIYGVLESNGIKRRNHAERFNLSTPTFRFIEPRALKDNLLLVAGTMLYFGEGAKTGNTVDFTNANPAMHKLFITYLRRLFLIDEKKLRLYLYCFSDQNLHEIIKFWSGILNVDVRSFTKPYIRDCSQKKERTMEWGVLHIRYNDKRLLEKILFLCSDITANLINN
jgi:hypothetical protein